jgi:hypothetical protein
VDRIDFLAFEPQFLDHIAPVWDALPEGLRGRFRADERLMARAEARGIAAECISSRQVRGDLARPSANPGNGPIAFVASIGDTLVGRRLGYRRFIFMEHGAGQAYTDRVALNRHPSYAGGKDREDTIAFLVPNEYSAHLWRTAYPDARVEIVGCPKLDTLPGRQEGAGPVVAISFHWPAFICPEAGTAFGYYREALAPLAKAFTTIGHAHPKADWGIRLAARYSEVGIPFVMNFDDVCRQADVYVVDNSSTLFEFAATGRPVVVLNSPEYRREVNHGLRFWDAAHVGVNVERASGLIPAVARALDDAPDRKAAREDALDIVYAHRSGAAQRAATVIEEMLA